MKPNRTSQAKRSRFDKTDEYVKEDDDDDITEGKPCSDAQFADARRLNTQSTPPLTNALNLESVVTNQREMMGLIARNPDWFEIHADAVEIMLAVQKKAVME